MTEETKVEIRVSDEDIEATQVHWYGDEVVFIRQKEKGDSSPGHLVMLNRDEAAQVRDALTSFLS